MKASGKLYTCSLNLRLACGVIGACVDAASWSCYMARRHDSDSADKSQAADEADWFFTGLLYVDLSIDLSSVFLVVGLLRLMS